LLASTCVLVGLLRCDGRSVLQQQLVMATSSSLLTFKAYVVMFRGLLISLGMSQGKVHAYFSWSHVAGAARPESCAVIYLMSTRHAA